MTTPSTLTSNVIEAGGYVVAALIAAWATLRGKSQSGPAETQGQINDGFREFMTEANKKIEELTGEIRNLTQYNQSLAKLLRGMGVEVPVYEYKNGGVVEGIKALPSPSGASARKSGDHQDH